MRNTILLFTIICIFLILGVKLLAQDRENVEQIARLYNQWDHEYNLFIQDGLAYIATGTSGLQIVDISNPEEPDMVGYWDGNRGEARDVIVSGDYAFIADWIGGIYVINVSDPANPEYISNIDTPGEAEGITLSGDNCFVADGSRGIRVFNVDNPEEIEFVGSYNAANAYDIKISGRYGYIVCSNDFHIVDIRNPDDIIEVGYLRVYGRGVDVSGGYAYVAGAGLTVIDVSDPENPEVVGFLDNRIGFEEIEVRGDYAYLANRTRGLRIIDISSPEEPTEIGYYETHWDVWGVSVTGDYAYIVDHRMGLHVIDISNPEEPDEIGTYRTPGWARDIFVLGDYAYVADDHGGLRIIEVSDPENPEEVGFFDTRGYTYDVFISGNYAYLADFWEGLRIIDISDPTDPYEIGYLDRGEYYYNVYVNGNYAYMAASTAGLRLIDISDPENPEEISYFDTPGNASGVTVAGEYCFIADGESVRVLNISDPEDIFLVDWVNVQGSACEIVTSENYAYIATGLGLSIIDIRDPYELVVTGEYRSPRSATGIAIFENYAILGDELSGIRVLDVSDPENPEEVGYYNTSGKAEGVFVYEGLIYVADITNVGIYRFTRDGGEVRDLTVRLTEGWNLISINVTPPEEMWEREEGPDIVLMTERLSIDEDNHHIIIMKNEHGQFYAPGFGFNNIPYWELTEGYQVRVDEDVEAVWTGEPIEADADISLTEGWNLVAYFPTYELSAESPDYYVLSPIIEQLIIAKDARGNFMWPRFNYSNMLPWCEGKGYFVKVSEDVVLNYPPEQDERAMSIGLYEEAGEHWTTPTPTNRNMSVLITTLPGHDFKDGDQIGAFSPAGHLVGVGTIRKDGRCGIAVWGDDPTTDVIDGALENAQLSFRFWNGISETELQADWIEGDGTYVTDGMAAVSLEAEPAIPLTFCLNEPYPNPFNSTTSIFYNLPTPERVTVRIFDLAGREVVTLVEGRLDAGHHQSLWDASEAPSGIYFCRMEAGQYHETVKLMLLR